MHTDMRNKVPGNKVTRTHKLSFKRLYVCMYNYIAVSTRTLTPPTTGTD